MLLFLLLLDQRINQRVQKGIESGINCRTSFLNACIIHFHIRCSFQSFWLLIFCWSWNMMRKSNTLGYRYIKSFWEFFYPSISFRLWFRVISIEYNDYSLSFFLNTWPYPFILDVAWIKRTLPDTSQNSIETKRLSTYVSCSTIRTVLVGL